MLDAGIGLPLEPEVERPSIEAAATPSRRPARSSSRSPPFLTRDDAGRARRFLARSAPGPISARSDERQRGRCCPTSSPGPKGGRSLYRRAGLRGHEPDDGDAPRGGRGVPRLRLRPLAGLAGSGLRGRAGLADPRPGAAFRAIGYTVAFNMSEQPAASVNAGYTGAGLPIGLQIIGQRFDDRRGAAPSCRALEDLRGPQRDPGRIALEVPAAQRRIEGVAQAVAQQVEAEHRDGDRHARHDGEVGRLGPGTVCASLSMRPQLGFGGRMPRPR